MPVLRIEHSITDFDTWKSAFDRFASARASADVRGHRIHRPLDDSSYVMIDLDFDEVEEAERFLAFLKAQVWSSPEASPALDGTPSTRIIALEEAWVG